MSGFLDVERLGVVREIYSGRLFYRAMMRSACAGALVNDVGQEPVDLDLGELLQPARDVWAA